MIKFLLLGCFVYTIGEDHLRASLLRKLRCRFHSRGRILREDALLVEEIRSRHLLLFQASRDALCCEVCRREAIGKHSMLS